MAASLTALTAFTFVASVARAADDSAVHVAQSSDTFTLSNDHVQIEVDRADGTLKHIRSRTAGVWHDLTVNQTHAAYEAHGDDFANDPNKALYWDANADVSPVPTGLSLAKKGYFRPDDGEPRVDLVRQTSDRAEVSVRVAPTPLFPFDVDLRYVVLRGQSGVYVYAVLHHGEDQPAVTYYQNRFVVKTVMDGTFTQWAIGDGKFLPIPQGAITKQLSDATFELADGTIKTKYMNSVFWNDVPVYGYVGAHDGLWMIEASPEYHNGGPVKQGQTLHDNVMLRVMQSVHFGASAVDLKAGEPFEKVYGPFLVYANHGDGPQSLWQDARRQYEVERSQWPYRWVASPAYAHDRGEVSGTVALDGSPVQSAWAILTPSGTDWTRQTKGYAFWQRTHEDGSFDLPHVVPGVYDLYVSGADQPHDFVARRIRVFAGGHTELGALKWERESHGTRVWQIGRFDRSAAEFRGGDDARNFEMYKRYPIAFPHDVDFTIGTSDPARDWNYAQWTTYSERPDWQIHFALSSNESTTGTATLTFGFASAQPARGKSETDLRVVVNGTPIAAIHLPKTGTAGYRGGAQDSQYNVRTVSFDAALLKTTDNVISLRHADALPIAAFEAQQKDASIPANTTPGQVMYDAIRLDVDPSQTFVGQ